MEFGRYIEYIKNAGGEPKIEWFDEDWEPIGPTIRSQMVDANLIKEQEGTIRLVSEINKGK